MARPSVARVFPARLRHNAGLVRSLAPQAKIMACVKADGYGHGLVAVAQAIDDLVDGFAVACIEEALSLRDHGIRHPILLLEGPHSRGEVDEAYTHSLILCMSTWRQLEWLEAAPRKPPCWLKIDTGMHRLGFQPTQVRESLRRIEACLESSDDLVLCSHFAQADKPDDPLNDVQVREFDDNVAGLPYPHSLANSAAIFSRPATHRDWVRPGYMLYGGSPLFNRSAADLGLAAAMELSAEVISVRPVTTGETVGYGGRWTAARPSRIATLAIGYGDGYPRHAGDGTPVIIDGYLAPLAGRVSMDMITVDITDLPDSVGPGSRALLWGEQLGVDRIAACADTIGYELLAGMPPRVPRVLAE